MIPQHQMKYLSPEKCEVLRLHFKFLKEEMSIFFDSFPFYNPTLGVTSVYWDAENLGPKSDPGIFLKSSQTA